MKESSKNPSSSNQHSSNSHPSVSSNSSILTNNSQEASTLKPVNSIVRKKSLLVPLLSIVLIVLVGVALFFFKQPSPQGAIAATVNGEPIYAEDLQKTMALAPSIYGTVEQQEMLLNQTIDLVLLKQEARRRGVSVTENEIDARIQLILADTGKSLPELRIILAERDMTPDEFRESIRDMILIEKLSYEAITSRITITEKEIMDYYEANKEDFVPPRGGVRVSHILVETEEEARSIIALLNEGESFRRLAIENSIDPFTSESGGEIGIIVPDEDVDVTFRNAALALRENQFTQIPIKTGVGYHIIWREFDIIPIQRARTQVQAEITRQRQTAAFVSLMEGLRASADIRLYTPEGVISVPKRKPSSLDGFAACVASQGTLYITPWSEASQQQLAMFDGATELLNIVNCDENEVACENAKINRYPTWVLGRSNYALMSLEQISSRTNCDLP